MEYTNIKRPLAIILGGTFPHRELINNLKKRGYYTLLIDYYEKPPAKKMADEHLKESTLDKNKVLEIAEKRNAELVISTCIDQANVTACYVSEKLGLSAPYSYETALTVTNKVLMKKKMIQNGIQTSKYVYIKEISDLAAIDLAFPLIVKPADSNSSKGVRKAENQNELIDYCREAMKISRNNECIVEEFAEGKEIGVDCFISHKKAEIIMTRERRKIAFYNDPLQQIQGSFWPADISTNNYINLKRIAENIAYSFNLDNTPLIIQTIIHDEKIHVIEFGARIGGGENYKIIKLHTGFDIIDSAIDSFLGKPVDLVYSNQKFYYADIYLYALPSRFGEINGYKTLLKNKIIEYMHIYKEKNDFISKDISSNNRIGAFLVKGNNKRELLTKINTALETIEINDINGDSIMRKDIYSNDKRKK